MQSTVQAFVAAPGRFAASHPRGRKAMAVSCAQKNTDRTSFSIDGAKMFAAGLAAAAFITGVPSVEAKVILTQPEVKNFVKDTPASSPAATKSAPAKKTPKAAETSEGFDFKPLVLPLSLITVAGGGFALYTSDPGFAKMMEEAGAKDSRMFAGYETNLKDTPFFGGSGSINPPKGAAPVAKKAKGKKGGLFS